MIAKKFPESKFLKIVAEKAIPNYPDSNLPTLIVYKDGDPLTQIVGITSMGGSTIAPEGLSLFWCQFTSL